MYGLKVVIVNFPPATVESCSQLFSSGFLKKKDQVNVKLQANRRIHGKKAGCGLDNEKSDLV